MFVLMFRTVFVYFVIVFSMRLMGKKQLGELQPSELVSTILISNLASICIESPEIPLAGSIVPVLLIVCLEILVSTVCLYSRRLSLLISGRPKIIIEDGKIDRQLLHRLRFTPDDLLEALRGKDIFELEDVGLAIVETNGSISVYKRFEADTITHDDLPFFKPDSRRPSLPVMVMGQSDLEAMRCVNLSREKLQGILSAEGCKAQKVLLLLCNDRGEYQLIKKEGQA